MRILSDDGAPGTITGYASPIQGRVDVAWDGGVVTHSFDPVGWLPDLTDPATLGCLLALVREAWGDPTAMVSPIKGCDGSCDSWVCYVYPCEDRERRYLAASEPACLIAALAAAPVKP